MYRRLALVILSLATGSLMAQQLTDEVGTNRVRISDEQVLAAIRGNNVADIEILIQAGWDPSRPVKLGERKNAVGLVEPYVAHPVAIAIQSKAYDVVQLISDRSRVADANLQDQAGRPVWRSIYFDAKWTPARAEDSEKAYQVIRTILQSKTPRVDGKEHLIADLYEKWPIRGVDRLRLYQAGLIGPTDLAGDVGARVFNNALRQYRLTAAVSEEAAAAELKTIMSAGVKPAAIESTLFNERNGAIGNSCGTFGQYFESWCDNTNVLDKRAAVILSDAGWRPSPDAVNAFWRARWLPEGDHRSYRDFSCASKLNLDLIPYTSIASGFRDISASSPKAQPTLDLLSVPSFRPTGAVLSDLGKAVERYDRKHAGNDDCLSSAKCPPTRQTFCGAAYVASGGSLD